MNTKSDGGLRIRDIHAFNVAMLGKLSWWIVQNPRRLFVCVLLEKYCYGPSFLSISCSTSASHVWRGILFAEISSRHNSANLSATTRQQTHGQIIGSPPRRTSYPLVRRVIWRETLWSQTCLLEVPTLGTDTT